MTKEIPWSLMDRARRALCLSCKYWVMHQIDGNYCSGNFIGKITIHKDRIECLYHKNK